MPMPTFPPAQQAQIIRANQRDLYHVSSLREQTESVLRSWLGTRWLTRWDKEVEFLVKLAYYGLTTGRATQTLGEEYTDIWQHSAFTHRTPPSPQARALLVLLPTLPSYLLAKWGGSPLLGFNYPRLNTLIRRLPSILEVVSEVNLALFYLQGTYYDTVKRLLGIRHISSISENPNTRPPSYSLLGVLLAIRLLHRLIQYVQTRPTETRIGKEQATSQSDGRETFLDERPTSSLLGPDNAEGDVAKAAEDDDRTILDVASISVDLRDGRKCTLCLEERTESCATECGHLFCWSCIVGWGREKPECPLCRSSLSLTRLLPVYNL